MRILSPQPLKLGLFLIPKTDQQGFTLIELLIVVIIVGILSAIAIPNLLAQVGKARESEAKKTIGAVNRSQQTYFSENGDFARSFSNLEIPTPTDTYYTYMLTGSASILARGKDNPKNGTRSYSGSVQYALTTRTFDTIICRGKVAPNYNITTLVDSGIVNDSTIEPLYCDPSDSQPVK